MTLWHWIVIALLVAALGFIGWQASRGEPDELSKVRGWLALLVCSLVAIGPLVTIGGLASAIASSEAGNLMLRYVPEWQSAKRAMWIIAVTSSLITAYAGLLLALTRQRRAVWQAIAALWIAGPVATLAVAMYAGPALGVIGELLRSGIAAGVWTAYLLRSKRVRARFGAGDTGQGLPIGQAAPHA